MSETFGKSRIPWLLALAAIVLQGLAVAQVALAATFNIPDGDTVALINAIDAANANSEADTIHLAQDGTYILTAEVDVELGLPLVTSTIRVEGHGAILKRSGADGTPRFRFLGVMTDGRLTLNNMTLRNGLATVGGAIGVAGELTLNDCEIRDNDGGVAGGGILNTETGATTLNDSRLSSNSASSGGGIFNQGGRVTLTGSRLSDNTASSGGGIWNLGGGTVKLMNSTMSGNSADFGGGIWNHGGVGDAGEGGTVILINSTLSGSTADVGGGIWNHSSVYDTATGGTVILTNSTLSGNTADAGAGIWNWRGGFTGSRRGKVILISSTISDNHAEQGGGIYADVASEGEDGSVFLKNTVIAGNTAAFGPDCAEADFTSLGYNLIGNLADCSLVAYSGDQLGVDPQLGPLQMNGGPTETHLQATGSPVVNAANPAGCTDYGGNRLWTDQRGVPRASGLCDIGAVELSGSFPIPFVIEIIVGKRFIAGIIIIIIIGSIPFWMGWRRRAP